MVDETVVVWIGKLAAYWPARIMIDFGRITPVRLPGTTLTMSPPAGAGLPRLTVPTTEPPPLTELGSIVSMRAAGGAGLIVRRALFVPPRYVAEMFAVLCCATTVVETLKDADLCPAGTTTDPGTDAAALSDPKCTTAPPLGAG